MSELEDQQQHIAEYLDDEHLDQPVDIVHARYRTVLCPPRQETAEELMAYCSSIRQWMQDCRRRFASADIVGRSEYHDRLM